MKLKHLYNPKGFITLAIAIGSLAIAPTPSHAISLEKLNSDLNKLLQGVTDQAEEYFDEAYDRLLGEEVAGQIPDSLEEILGGEVGPEFHKITELAQTIASEDSLSAQAFVRSGDILLGYLA
ncbi:MAG: hypothetical protein AAFY41_14305 [Bacteroidota bacterium]